MKCIICKLGETAPGTTTVTLERDELTLVVKNVPAEVCNNCNEAYVDDKTTTNLLQTAEEMVQAGALVDVRQYITL